MKGPGDLYTGPDFECDCGVDDCDCVETARTEAAITYEESFRDHDDRRY